MMIAQSVMIKDFFRILSAQSHENSEYRYEVELNNSHSIYDGHFPGMPVTPGVCTLDIVKSCVADAVGYEVRYETIRDCKFLDTIIPTQGKRLEVIFLAEMSENESLKLSSTVVDGDKVMMKLKAGLVRA